MTERFILLRGAQCRVFYLARLDQPDDADGWTEDRADARRFADRADAEAARAEIVVRDGIAVAVVPK